MRAVSKIVLLVLLLGSVCFGQEQVLRLIGPWTLNTKSGDFALKPTECRQAHNVDWSRYFGSIAKREGYDSVSAISGQDSALGLYASYESDGTQRLVFVTDSAGVGYGNVYVSPTGKAYFIGKRKWGLWNNPHNAYTYTVQVAWSTDTVSVSYVSDASATYVEIEENLIDSVNAHPSAADNIEAVNYWRNAWGINELVEGLGITITVDTAQSVAASPKVSYSRIATHWSVQAQPEFAMYNDMVYMVNGRQKGLVYDGSVARQWPLNAPGEITCVPLDVSGPLHGEYRYVVTYRRQDSTMYTNLSLVGAPVIVDNGQVLLKGFQWVEADIVSCDSVYLRVYRTKANPGQITDADYAYYTGIEIAAATEDGLADTLLTDSISDNSLSATDSICLVDTTQVGRLADNTYSHRYGSPGYISTPAKTSYDTSDAGENVGIFYGIPKQDDTLGVVYAMAFIDTVTNTQSPLGPPLAVQVPTAEQDGAAKASKIRVSVPPIPAGDSAIVRNLYRAHIFQVTHDSTFNPLQNMYDSLQTRTTFWNMWGDSYTDLYIRSWISLTLVDTVIIGEFRLLSQVERDSIAYTDSVRYDSLHSMPMFITRVPSSRLKNIFSFDGRMFGTDGSRLYFSRLDSASVWGAFDFISLNEDDGDEITLAYPSRGAVRVFKNASNYNVYQDANGNWSRREISGHVGCIAPKSHAASPAGHYYLSQYGVIRETEGDYLERTHQTELVSVTLDNFENLSQTSLASAVGSYHDRKYMLSIGDTTYVYDETANSWSTWSLTFAAATEYSVETETGFLPGDTMYFIRSGDNNLYRYGTAEKDNGAEFATVWMSAPLLANHAGYEMIDKVMMAHNADDDSSTVQVYFYDHTGSIIAGLGDYDLHYMTFDSLTTRYTLKSALPHTDAVYHQLFILTSTQTSNSDTRIDEIDVYWRPTRPLMVE